MGSFDCWSYVPTGTGRWVSTVFPWHTHGSILASVSGKDEETAIENFVADLTSGKSIIAVKRINGSVADVWVGHGRSGGRSLQFAKIWSR
ncbi:hypothetical protein [Bradyrhizobium liaoningense]